MVREVHVIFVECIQWGGGRVELDSGHSLIQIVNYVVLHTYTHIGQYCREREKAALKFAKVLFLNLFGNGKFCKS